MGIISSITSFGGQVWSGASTAYSTYVAPTVVRVTQPVQTAVSTGTRVVTTAVSRPVQTVQTRVIQPVQQQVIQPIQQRVIQPVQQQVIQPIQTKVIQPIQQQVIKPVTFGINLAPKVITSVVAPKVASTVIQPIQQRVIQPVQQQIVKPVTFGINLAPKIVTSMTKPIEFRLQKPQGYSMSSMGPGNGVFRTDVLGGSTSISSRAITPLSVFTLPVTGLKTAIDVFRSPLPITKRPGATVTTWSDPSGYTFASSLGKTEVRDINPLRAAASQMFDKFQPAITNTKSTLVSLAPRAGGALLSTHPLSKPLVFATGVLATNIPSTSGIYQNDRVRSILQPASKAMDAIVPFSGQAVRPFTIYNFDENYSTKGLRKDLLKFGVWNVNIINKKPSDIGQFTESVDAYGRTYPKALNKDTIILTRAGTGGLGGPVYGIKDDSIAGVHFGEGKPGLWGSGRIWVKSDRDVPMRIWHERMHAYRQDWVDAGGERPTDLISTIRTTGSGFVNQLALELQPFPKLYNPNEGYVGGQRGVKGVPVSLPPLPPPVTVSISGPPLPPTTYGPDTRALKLGGRDVGIIQGVAAAGGKLVSTGLGAVTSLKSAAGAGISGVGNVTLDLFGRRTAGLQQGYTALQQRADALNTTGKQITEKFATDALEASWLKENVTKHNAFGGVIQQDAARLNQGISDFNKLPAPTTEAEYNARLAKANEFVAEGDRIGAMVGQYDAEGNRLNVWNQTMVGKDAENQAIARAYGNETDSFNQTAAALEVQKKQVESTGMFGLQGWWNQQNERVSSIYSKYMPPAEKVAPATFLLGLATTPGGPFAGVGEQIGGKIGQSIVRRISPTLGAADKTVPTLPEFRQMYFAEKYTGIREKPLTQAVFFGIGVAGAAIGGVVSASPKLTAVASKGVPVIGQRVLPVVGELSYGKALVGAMSVFYGADIARDVAIQPTTSDRFRVLARRASTEIEPMMMGGLAYSYAPGAYQATARAGTSTQRILGSLYDKSRIVWHGTGEVTGLSLMERANLGSTGLVRQANIPGRVRSFTSGLTEVYVRHMGKITPGYESIRPGGEKTYRMPTKMNYDYVSGKFKPAADQSIGRFDRLFRVDYSLKPPSQTAIGQSVSQYVRPQFFDYATVIPRSPSVGKAWRNKIIATQQDLVSGLSERIAPRTADYYYKTSLSNVKLSRRLPITEETVAGHEYVWARNRLLSRPENMPKDVLGKLTKRVDFFERHPIRSNIGTNRAVEANWPKVEAQLRANEAANQFRTQQVDRLADQVLGKGTTIKTGSKVYEYQAGGKTVRLVKQLRSTSGVGETIPTRVEKYSGRYLSNQPGRITVRPEDVPTSLWYDVEKTILSRTLKGSTKVPRLEKGNIGLESVGKEVQPSKVYEYWAGPTRVRLVKSPVRAKPTGVSTKDDLGLDKVVYQIGDKKFYSYWEGAKRVTLTKKVPGVEFVEQQPTTRTAWELQRWLDGTPAKTSSHPLRWKQVERDVIPLKQDSAYWNRISARLRYSSASPEEVNARSVWGALKKPVKYDKLITYQAGPTTVSLRKVTTKPPITPLSKTFGKPTTGAKPTSATALVIPKEKPVSPPATAKDLGRSTVVQDMNRALGTDTAPLSRSTGTPVYSPPSSAIRPGERMDAYGIDIPTARKRRIQFFDDDTVSAYGPMSLGGTGAVVVPNLRDQFDTAADRSRGTFSGISIIPTIALVGETGLGSRTTLIPTRSVKPPDPQKYDPITVPKLRLDPIRAQVPGIASITAPQFDVGQLPGMGQINLQSPAIGQINLQMPAMDQLTLQQPRLDVMQIQRPVMDTFIIRQPPFEPPTIPPIEIPFIPIIPPFTPPPLAGAGGGGGGGAGGFRTGSEFVETMPLGDFLSDTFGGAGMDFGGMRDVSTASFMSGAWGGAKPPRKTKRRKKSK